MAIKSWISTAAQGSVGKISPLYIFGIVILHSVVTLPLSWKLFFSIFSPKCYNGRAARSSLIKWHLADQVSKNFFSSWTDLNKLLDAGFNAGYESDIRCVKKSRFSHPKSSFRSSKNRILSFLTKNVIPNMPFDGEFHSLQNGLFGFHFDNWGRFIALCVVSHFLLRFWAPISMDRSNFFIEHLATHKDSPFEKSNHLDHVKGPKNGWQKLCHTVTFVFSIFYVKKRS